MGWVITPVIGILRMEFINGRDIVDREKLEMGKTKAGEVIETGTMAFFGLSVFFDEA